MKDNELRRGDYVLFYDKHKLGKIAIVDQVLRYSCLLLYDQQIGANKWEDEILIEYKKINPLHLTYQILERLGFIYDGANYVYNIYDTTKTIIEDTIKIEPCNTERTKWLFRGASLEYVHELQHLLKDFKINKNIVKL